MKSLTAILGMLMGCMAPLACTASTPPAPAAATDTLSGTISALDAAVFDAFNHCSSAVRLAQHGSFFAPDVEFYHDTGGVTWSRQDMLAKTSKNVCGNFRRELVPGTLKVFPIKDFGAIEVGSHRFCQFATGIANGLD